MAESDWVDVEDDGDWVDIPKDEKPGYLESGARGLAQGGSFGFADEITGALESAFSDKTYEQARDESRANYDSAQKANPKTFGAGQVGGAVGSAFIPGLGGAGLAKLAAQGAAHGLGASNADLTKGDYAGAAKDTAIGLGTGLAAGGLSKALPAIGAGARGVIDDVASAPLGKEGARGLVAKGLDLTHRAGAAGNKMVDDVISAVTPATGDKTADALVKGATRIGRYNPITAKVQGALDTAEYGPKAVQWGAQKASSLIDKAGPTGAYATDLAQRSPLVYQHLTNKKQTSRPPATEDLIQKTQGSKFANILQNAAQRGDKAVAASHFVLQQQNPEYRQLMDEDGDEY